MNILIFQNHAESSHDASDQLLKLQPEEHIIAYWIERNNDIKWYLGIVVNMKPEGGIVVPYMIKADINDTSSDQIIAAKVQVHCSGSVKIKCQFEFD